MSARHSVKRWIGGVCGLSCLLLVLFLVPALETVAGVVGSRHDLSTATVYSDQVCVFCHTPHYANTDVVAPLWNRFVDLSQTFTLYSSSTMNTVPGQPTTTVSGICLGCHDGTSGTAVFNSIAGSTKHDLLNAPGPGGTPDMTSDPNCRRCHGEMYGDPPARWQGTDLSNDHPITMTYPTPSQDAEFNIPPDLVSGWSDVGLFGGRIECPSCHDPHDTTYGTFLVKSNANSQLCTTCHQK